MATPFVIGIDGGGTRTRVCVAALDGETQVLYEAGASAVSIHGMAGAQHILQTAIAAAVSQAGVDLRDLQAICFGLSGVDRPDERAPMLQWATAQFTPNAEVVNDCEIVLEAGAETGWGVALIAGTGAIAFGKSPDGVRARAGGWGYLIGDEGSAYDIAREGLRAALRAADGRGEPTQLVDAILQHFKIDRASALVPAVYRHNKTDAGATLIRPDQMAALAPLVTQAAAQGDAVAQNIVQCAGHELALDVLAVARRLQLLSPVPLALAGSLLLKVDAVRAGLMASLAQSDFVFAPVKHVTEPVRGAVKVALRLTQENKIA